MLVRRITSDWDMPFGHGLADYARDSEAVAILVKQRLLLIKAEWFLDTSQGIPYTTDIARKPANLPLAESAIKKAIIETEGVQEITAFQLTYDREIRKLYVQVSVRTIYGNILNIKESLI